MGKHDKKKKKKHSAKSVIVICLICVLAIISTTFVYLYFSFRNYSYVKDNKEILNPIDEIDSSNDYKEAEGITNILLLGSDARTLEEQARADAILILSIDNVHKKLKLVSFMRDIYVEIPGHGKQKINHAHAIGGTDLLIRTIQKNFKIKIDNYAIINFGGFQKLIDSIGGLELDVSSSEMKEMNKFIPEVNPKNPHLVKEPGFQHLDGQQVLSYARIRKIGNGDYDRTKRQREVITAVINKLKDTSILKYPKVARNLFPYIKTNVSLGEATNYAFTIYKINNFTPEQLLIPVPEITDSKILINKGWVLLTDIEQSVKILNDFIFNDIRYTNKDLDFASFYKAMEQYKEEISTNPKDAEETEPIYNKDEIEDDDKEDGIDNNEDDEENEAETPVEEIPQEETPQEEDKEQQEEDNKPGKDENKGEDKDENEDNPPKDEDDRVDEDDKVNEDEEKEAVSDTENTDKTEKSSNTSQKDKAAI